MAGDSMLARIVRILSAFDHAHPSLTPEALAARAQLPASTAYRIVSQLMAYELLSRDADGRLRVGVGMWELANRASDTMELGRVARPHMARVQRFVGEHTHLAILRESEVLYLERLSAPGAVPNIGAVAGRLPAHASAAGLVLLARQPARVRDAYLARPLRAVTEHTITDPARLRAMLVHIRRNELAHLSGHMVAGTSSLAVPVFDASGTAAAALGIVVDTVRRPPTEALVGALRTASQGITADLAAGAPGAADAPGAPDGPGAPGAADAP